MTQQLKAVFLDRDGVINFDSPDYILSVDQWRPIPGSLEAIARLTRAGISIAIVSNQSALGRGLISRRVFDQIHGKMMLLIEEAGGFIAHVAYCLHAPDSGCACRKPLPGMIIETLNILGLKERPDQTLFIGDSIRDVEAADAAGVPAMLVQSGYGNAEKILERSRLIMPSIPACADLGTAAAVLLDDK